MLLEMKRFMQSLKPFSDKTYDSIMQWVGTGWYQIVDQYKDLPKGIFSQQPAWESANFVVAASGTTLCDYSFSYNATSQSVKRDTQSIVVPKDSEIVIVRFLRYDDTHGPSPHYNADDQIFFPTKQGDIYRMSREDARDHYLAIAENSTVADIAGAYKLPKKKSGRINTYTENGASLPIKLYPILDE